MQTAFDGAKLHSEALGQLWVQVASAVHFEQRGVLRWEFIERLPNVALLR